MKWLESKNITSNHAISLYLAFETNGRQNQTFSSSEFANIRRTEQIS
jgi:hypothetical protein